MTAKNSFPPPISLILLASGIDLTPLVPKYLCKQCFQYWPAKSLKELKEFERIEIRQVKKYRKYENKYKIGFKFIHFDTGDFVKFRLSTQ